MGISLYLSIGAIIIACISLFWSIYLGYRDRGNIKATSEINYTVIASYSEKPSKKIPNLKIKAVNCGRRPVILSVFGTDYSDGSWGDTLIEKKGGHLSENEEYKKIINAGDSDMKSPKGKIAVDFWFEDTLCRRYKVKNAKENLKKLWGES
jgi:hypothetical protein